MWKYKKHILKQKRSRSKSRDRSTNIKEESKEVKVNEMKEKVEDKKEEKKEEDYDRKNYVNSEGLTKQDIMAQDIEGTKKKWISDGFCKLENKEDILQLDPKKTKYYIKYISKEDKVRGGGQLSFINNEKDNEYIRILSFMAGFKAFSVQLKNIKEIYYRVQIPKNRKEDDIEIYNKLKGIHEEHKYRTKTNFWKFIKENKNLYEGLKIGKKHVDFYMNSRLLPEK